MPFRRHPPHCLAPPPGFAVHAAPLSGGVLRLAAGGQGPPLVLVHGLGGAGEDFHPLAPLLARRFTVLIPDLLGFGGSDKPDAAYTVDWHRRTLEELAEVLGLAGAGWVGHSLGGQLVLELALARPGLAGRVAALCPAGGHRRRPPEWRLFRWLVASGCCRLRFRSARLARWWLPWAAFSEPGLPAARALAERQVRRWSGREAREVERAFVRTALALMDRPLWPRAGGLGRPALVVTASRDRVVPAGHTARLLAHLPAGVRRLELSCGHMPTYSRPRRLARALLDFWPARR
jgi:pimeloyl-ACP methyl ester carboxylesterase